MIQKNPPTISMPGPLSLHQNLHKKTHIVIFHYYANLQYLSTIFHRLLHYHRFPIYLQFSDNLINIIVSPNYSHNMRQSIAFGEPWKIEWKMKNEKIFPCPLKMH